MNPLDSLIIRPGAPGDVARVYKDWLLSHATSDFAHYCTPRHDWIKRASELFWKWQRSIIDGCLARGELWCASWSEDTSTIAGWCVLERAATVPVDDRDFRGAHYMLPAVHYVYVAPSYRVRGIAKRLLAPMLEEPRVTYTHRSQLAKHLPIPPGWTFDPRPALVPVHPKDA